MSGTGEARKILGIASFVLRNRCTPTTYRAGGLMGAGIVVMVLAALVIAFTIGPTWMFVGLGGGFLAGSLSVLASGTSQLIALIVVWGLIGVLFLLIGGLGLRSERRDRQGAVAWPDSGRA